MRTLTLARFWAGVAAGFVLVLGFALAALAAVPAALGPWSAVVVESGSMRPAIEVGDVVLLDPVDPTDADQLGPPTVVLVDDPARDLPLLHRIVEALPDGGGYRTQGDANANVDSAEVPADAVRGTGRVLVPLVGLPMLWLADGSWWRVAALLGGIGLLAWLARFGWSDIHDPWTRRIRGDLPAVPRPTTLTATLTTTSC